MSEEDIETAIEAATVIAIEATASDELQNNPEYSIELFDIISE